MVVLRSLLYVGIVVAVVASWYLSHRSKTTATVPFEPEQTLDPAAPEALVAALDHPRWQVRLEAVKALADPADAASLNRLLAMLADPVLEIRDAAATQIARFGDGAIAPLEQILATGKLNTREAAIMTLCHIGSPATLAPLVHVLAKDESAWIRIPAAQQLGVLGGGQAIAALTQALADPHPEVVRAARAALSLHPPQASDPIDEHLMS